VVWSPASELVDDEKEFRTRIALPGFDAKEIQVSALPDALVSGRWRSWLATYANSSRDVAARGASVAPR
jgi:HSP20 family molecular chaperone IbpA